MVRLLSVETSTQACSAAIHQEGKLLAVRKTHEPRSAASQLAVMINAVLEESATQPAGLSGVVVAAGPGSYTGLRIGVATAKGICFALNIPLVSVNTLDLLAYQGKEFENRYTTLLCPMVDARRMEVYCKVVDYNLNEVEPTQAKIINATSFQEYLEKTTVCFIGEGSAKCKETIIHPNAKFLDEVIPCASQLGIIGYTKWIQQEFENVAAFEPFYLKDFLIRKPTAS
ncbi:MAG: tRNA (adenosine(37)-N6)-threonylcarbamoyltransferase complex dimerization subunit type 1 TsaB [Cytophagales bacterium]|jgi:tRNA threonylcarbamoyladenosine biosynthesis protein TsaB|nr:tRNA (adenosine(37)-N6)-threonylcarbamoyltransferase complex dimerization subunit type 1 TsaB [Cytophagales bacterium]HMR57056.1 tRNA (adenosine(37)-N6)-threonylcarbamoyltransferase complex dimerization subunit type 1 TsaB [Cyclobacteriaceae bacterium]HRE68835.1 tRNA (adenosine(37)-N6)-threonylcarbamoyltransferase complex dimerization subunit type 1 TsaB [Cyclobacteriaceae bacterium]